MNNILYHGNIGIEYPCPSLILLNNEIQNLTTCYKIYISEAGSNVTLIWNDSLNSIYCLFCGCLNITEIIFSNFDYSSITNMDCLFHNLVSLTSVDLSNLYTTNVNSMRYMFYNCRSIKYLNLSNFNTSRVTDMFNMFCNCKNLTSIDLSNFDISKVMNMNNMFKSCENLKHINLLNFKYNSKLLTKNIFSGIANNSIICIDKNNPLSMYKLLSDSKCITTPYKFDWWTAHCKINKTGNCIINYNSTIYTDEYKEKCYNVCLDNSALYYTSEFEMKIYHCEPRCPKEYPFENIETHTCVKHCSIAEREREICKMNFISDDENNKEVEEKEIENTKEELSNGFNTTDINDGKNLIIKQKDVTITITNTENQKKSLNLSSIDLGECENEIKKNIIYQTTNLYIY